MIKRIVICLNLVLLGGSALADCLSPMAVEGTMMYLAPNLKVCDGNAWSTMDAGSPGSACSTAGRVEFSGGVPRFCSPSGYVTLDGSTTGASCAGTVANTVTYNSTAKYMHYCDGTNWKPMQSPSSGIAFVQQATVNRNVANVTTATTSTFASALTASNLLACIIVYDSLTNSVAAVTATGSQAFTKAGTDTPAVGGAAAAFRMEVWYRQNISAATSPSIKIDLTGPASTLLMALCNEYSGISPTNALDQAVGIGNVATNPGSLGPYTSTSSKELIFAPGSSDSGAPTPGTGYTQRGAVLNDIITQDRIVTTTGSYSATINRGPGGTRVSLFFVSFRGR